ncbi:hypothetical protein PR202_gb07759 [Eleusine coracana subsp. coracana]|uniref:Uncharacterized protein n=1 Tax=Eleusine coracana subsp. coracana TaxID=191504 RepID=A0AAV5ECC6_ELECO|nr:hypothetical protein PR202_gb07759 [Eleusine coracana subsp. coracana]
MRASKAVKAATAACILRLVRGGGGCRAFDGTAGSFGLAAGADPRRRAPANHAVRRVQSLRAAHNQQRQGEGLVAACRPAPGFRRLSGRDVSTGRLHPERGRGGLHPVPEAVLGRGRRGQAVERHRSGRRRG